jgi:serine/threonine protein kinase
VGRRLGVGGFGVVLEIKSFDNDMVKIGQDECDDTIIMEDEDFITEEMDAKIFISKHAVRNGAARYAIKKLRDDLSEEKRENGVLDLAIESKVLSTLMHPNIVKLRGVASNDPLSPGFFLVMDRLFGTLEERIEKEWRPKYTTPRRLFCGGVQQSQSLDFMTERMFIAYDIASALRYLHKNK